MIKNTFIFIYKRSIHSKKWSLYTKFGMYKYSQYKSSIYVTYCTTCIQHWEPFPCSNRTVHVNKVNTMAADALAPYIVTSLNNGNTQN